jgi:hypothetical protein
LRRSSPNIAVGEQPPGLVKPMLDMKVNKRSNTISSTPLAGNSVAPQ